MKKNSLRLIEVLLIVVMLQGCASIPKESVTLSQCVSNDLSGYKTSHLEITEKYFDKIEDDINRFIDKRITPALINEMVRMDIADSENDSQSLFAILSKVKENPSEANTSEAISAIADFQSAINSEIETYRAELLAPIREQRIATLKQISESYDATIAAQSSLTTYISSVVKIKEKQDAILSYTGMTGVNDSITSRLVSISSDIDKLTNKVSDLSSSQLYNSVSAIINKLAPQ